MQIDIELLLNLPTLRVRDCSITEKETHIYCESVLESGYCPVCLKASKEVKMYQQREVRDLSLLGRKVYLHLRTRQFHCLNCKRYFNERYDFVAPNKTLTTRFEHYLYKMSEHICLTQVSVKEDVCWPTVNEIHARYAQKELAGRAVWHQLRYLGIDEISVRKGSKNYACCLVDLERGIVLDFLESRRKESLIAYFKAKGTHFCNQIEVVSSDMWDAYSTLPGDLFPNAESVIDRYHFFVHLNKALDATRKSVRKVFADQQAFKNIRWALLKNPVKLSADEKSMLEKAFKFNDQLLEVYQLRQELKELFDTDLSKQEALNRLQKWEEKARKVENKPMESFLKILDNWKDKVFNFFHKRLSNGMVEGINNAIRGIIRRSFGFHSFDNLKRRVLVELG